MTALPWECEEIMRPSGRGELESLYFEYPQFDFERPGELDGERIRHRVAIVGGGPVGLITAIALASHGIASVLLDEKTTVNDGSRAICLSRYSMETLQQLGLAERFCESALSWSEGRSYFRNQLAFRLRMPDSDNERFRPMYNLQQQYIEQYLVDRADDSALIELRWQSRVTDVAVHDDGATLEVETPEGSYRLEAQFVAAADGARSVVRSALGLALRGEAYEGRYVIADIIMKSAFPTERRAFFDSVANPDETILVHKQPGDLWRVDWQLKEGESEAVAVEEDNIRQRIGDIVDMLNDIEGEQCTWDLEWWSIYKAYTLCLDDYRHGPVLFIGDAAHLVPIFGVRGLNNGIADAVNAAWRLAYHLEHGAPGQVLEPYSPERRGATLDVFEHSSKSTRFMTPPTRGYRLMRDAALSLALSHDFAKPFMDPRQVQPYDYTESSSTSYRHEDAKFHTGPRAGAPAENHRLGDADYLLDHVGLGFTLLAFDETGAWTATFAAVHRELVDIDPRFRTIIVGPTPEHGDEPRPGNMSFIADDGANIARHYGAHNGSGYLLRPDRHVAARWQTIDAANVVHAMHRSLGFRPNVGEG
jgi:3-(3-hydroxy-phenyl)propionate hydroxylase